MGAGYRFELQKCECVFVQPTKVSVQFLSCGNYMILDTDYNLPSWDVYIRQKKEISGDPCSDIYDKDYGLRQTTLNDLAYFNIYPVAG
jgi:hypothetical protein